MRYGLSKNLGGYAINDIICLVCTRGRVHNQRQDPGARTSIWGKADVGFYLGAGTV